MFTSLSYWTNKAGTKDNTETLTGFGFTTTVFLHIKIDPLLLWADSIPSAPKATDSNQPIFPLWFLIFADQKKNNLCNVLEHRPGFAQSRCSYWFSSTPLVEVVTGCTCVGLRRCLVIIAMTQIEAGVKHHWLFPLTQIKQADRVLFPPIVET